MAGNTASGKENEQKIQSYFYFYQVLVFKLAVITDCFTSGVYKNDGPYKAYIDISNVPELKKCSVDNRAGIVLGAAVTLTEMIDFLKNKVANMDGFEYGKYMGNHIERVANVPVRNVSEKYISALLNRTEVKS